MENAACGNGEHACLNFRCLQERLNLWGDRAAATSNLWGDRAAATSTHIHSFIQLAHALDELWAQGEALQRGTERRVMYLRKILFGYRRHRG
jgi:hypothetical protein